VVWQRAKKVFRSPIGDVELPAKRRKDGASIYSLQTWLTQAGATGLKKTWLRPSSIPGSVKAITSGEICTEEREREEVILIATPHLF
jgi:hypothetical protein